MRRVDLFLRFFDHSHLGSIQKQRLNSWKKLFQRKVGDIRKVNPTTLSNVTARVTKADDALINRATKIPVQ